MPNCLDSRCPLAMPQKAYGLLHHEISVRSSNLICSQRILQLPNRFEIFHRAWQYHCHALWKFQNDLTTQMDDEDKPNFARFQFKMIFRRISYIVTAPDCLCWITSDLSGEYTAWMAWQLWCILYLMLAKYNRYTSYTSCLPNNSFFLDNNSSNKEADFQFIPCHNL